METVIILSDVITILADIFLIVLIIRRWKK